jgi:hypothetical protein
MLQVWNIYLQYIWAIFSVNEYSIHGASRIFSKQDPMSHTAPREVRRWKRQIPQWPAVQRARALGNGPKRHGRVNAPGEAASHG